MSYHKTMHQAEVSNILFAYPFPDVKGGTEITMHAWAQILREGGNKVYLAHGYDSPPETSHYYDGVVGVPAVFNRHSKLNPPGFDQELKQVDAFISANSIDLIHTHTYPRTEAITYWADRYPLVVNVHVPLCPNGARYFWKERNVCDRQVGFGCFSVGYLNKGCGYLGNGLPMSSLAFARSMWDDFYLRRGIKKASLILGNSRWMMDRLERDGFSSSMLRLIHPFEMAGPGDGENFDQRVSPPAILFVGRMVGFKGADHVLLASKEIATPHQVWFVGDGPAREECEKLARELGIEDRVTFWGELKGEAINEMRRKSTVAVVPSLCPEGFGRVGPEAMMIQRPAVAYRVGGTAEWLEDGENGYLVAPGDYKQMAESIERLLVNDADAIKMGKAALDRCKQWTAEHHMKLLLEYYKEAVANKTIAAAKG